ncbi:hypothetical protein [Rhizobium leguminosarum]|uniref:hypothetical protein n=1 Tax=Rhizobium leguminosarum TaxID=384 RepID=UPI001D6AAE06|nr:hypothetical protein [Rhizobium leguminosarum]MBP2445954.1 hypothetical protein [Rhizobium leguminosarum]
MTVDTTKKTAVVHDGVTPGGWPLALEGSVSILQENSTFVATRSAARALTPDVASEFIQTAGFYAAGDRGAALYKKVAPEPSHNGKFSITLSDGISQVWYELVCDEANVLTFGAVNTGSSTLLSTRYATLADAQKDYPNASALTQQINDLAVANALGYAAAKHKTFFGFGPFPNAFPVFFPEGGYYITSIAQITISSHIYGAGVGVTSLLFAGAAGWSFSLADNDFVEMHDLDLLSVGPNTGTAISISGSSGQDVRNVANIHDILISSWGPTNYWNKGVFLQNVGDSFFERVRVQSSSVSHWVTSGFEIGTRCIDNHFSECAVQGATNAILIAGDSCEGLRVEDCTFIAVAYGVRKTSSGGNPPHWAIRGTHIAAYRSAVNMSHCSTVIIGECLFYLTDQAGVPTQNNDVCVYLDNCSGVRVIDSELGGQNDGLFQYGVVLANCLNVYLAGLYFAFFDIGISVSASTTNGFILYPTSFSVGTLVSNSGANVIVKTS